MLYVLRDVEPRYIIYYNNTFNAAAAAASHCALLLVLVAVILYFLMPLYMTTTTRKVKTKKKQQQLGWICSNVTCLASELRMVKEQQRRAHQTLHKNSGLVDVCMRARVLVCKHMDDLNEARTWQENYEVHHVGIRQSNSWLGVHRAINYIFFLLKFLCCLFFRLDMLARTTIELN